MNDENTTLLELSDADLADAVGGLTFDQWLRELERAFGQPQPPPGESPYW